MAVSKQDREDYERGLHDRDLGVFDQVINDITSGILIRTPTTRGAAANSWIRTGTTDRRRVLRASTPSGIQLNFWRSANDNGFLPTFDRNLTGLAV
jgi:hypothetical protein